MAKSFNELMQEMVNMNYDELLGLGKKALVDLLPVCKKVDEDNDGFLMLTSIILTAIGADGVLSTLERKYMGDLLGLDDELISKYIKMYSSKMVDLTDAFVDKMDSDSSAAALMLVTAIASVDEKICREETALIKKLFA